MAILHVSSSISTPLQSLSSSNSVAAQLLFLNTKISNLSLTSRSNFPSEMWTIRMGGGPRTYPGGVTKWQWKRMQEKKGKQLLQARLARERQIYEMRKRAELKAAVSELERPWEKIEKAPTLFSTSADEQLKVLADRFQKPGGFDLWSERDGPELFRPDNGLPSARFFPKGVVHSVKPYGRVGKISDGFHEFGSLSEEEGDTGTSGMDGETSFLQRKGNYANSNRRLKSGYEEGSSGADFGSISEDVTQEYQNTKFSKERFGKKGYSGKPLNDSEVRFQSSRRSARVDTGSGDSGRRYAKNGRLDTGSGDSGRRYANNGRLDTGSGDSGSRYANNGRLDTDSGDSGRRFANNRRLDTGSGRRYANNGRLHTGSDNSARRYANNGRLHTGSDNSGRRYTNNGRLDTDSGRRFASNRRLDTGSGDSGRRYANNGRLHTGSDNSGRSYVDNGWLDSDSGDSGSRYAENGRLETGSGRRYANNGRLDTAPGGSGRRYAWGKREDSNSGGYDMSRQNDGTYGFELDI